MAYSDIKKAKLVPEVLPECFTTGTVATGGTVVTNYTNFSPFYVTVNGIISDKGTNIVTQVSCDGAGEAMSIRAEGDTQFGFGATPNTLTAKDRFAITQFARGGAAENNIGMRYNVMVYKPTVVDKIRMGAALDETEKALDTKYKIKDRIDAGLLPGRASLLTDDIFRSFYGNTGGVKTVAETLPVVAAAGEYQVGRTLYPPRNHVIILLGIGVDAEKIRAEVGVNDTFVMVDRDNDSEYIKLDMAQMPNKNGTAGTTPYYMRMYIPAINEMRIRVESATGLLANTDFFYVYGIRPITDLDRIMWYPETKFSADEQRIKDLNLLEAVVSGVGDAVGAKA